MLFSRKRKGRRPSARSTTSSEDLDDLPGYQQLLVNDVVFSRSINAVRFAVFGDTLNSMVLYANYAFMALPGSHEDSFPSTAPFGFSSATYFIPMSGLLGMAISGVFAGKISDRIGRRPVILFCLAGSCFGSALKWFLRGSFWGFCIASFANGLLSGTLPVALAYCSDIFSSERQKAKSFTVIVGLYVIGQSIGGLLGVLMMRQGLFAPLWAGAAIVFGAFIINLMYLVEPGKIKVPARLGDENERDDDSNLPTSLDKKTMIHILFGAFTDICGSKALFPLCMSPLALEVFYLDFVNAGETPLMSENAYRWLIIFVSLLVVPSSVVTPRAFRRFGLAACCVFGNAITGVMIIVLLYIASISPPTSATLIGFMATMYAGFPFTVVSQLSISPMLDLLSPLDQRGFVQGSFTLILNCGNAIAPWLLGLATDALGTKNGLWIGVGLSFAATLINIPLMFKNQYQRKPLEKDTTLPTLTPEDEEMYVQKALKGEVIPARIIQTINANRLLSGEKYMVNHVGKYDKDRDQLGKICSDATNDLKYMRRNVQKILVKVANDPEAADLIPNMNRAWPDEMQNQHMEMGKWVGEYLKDNGYIGVNPVQSLKMMVIRSFPPINRDGEVTIDNFEETLLNMNRVYSQYLHDELSEERSALRNLFTRPPRRLAPIG